MAELTIEEKAQRYDKAIKKAKEWFNSEEPDSYTCIVESIFPELKENKDKRIRKAAITFVKDSSHFDYYLGVSKEEVIAWLEKQGETFTKKDVDDAYLEGMCVAKHELEKQCEQKPIKWSEEDKTMLCYMEGHLEYLKNDKGYSSIEDQIMLKRQLDWLKELKERVQTQPTWKPTDEMLEALYKALPKNVMEISEDEMLLDKLYQGLKYGRVLSEN